MLIGYRSSFMQRVQEAANHGYTSVVTGTVKIEKYDNLYRKFNAMYDVDMQKSKRSRQKAKGISLAKFLAHPEEGDMVRWVLMCTSGTGTFFEEEKRAIIPAKKIELFGQYRLTRETTKRHGKAVWTFHLTTEYKNTVKKLVHSYVHHKNDAGLRKIIHETNQLIPFSGVRQELYEIHKHIRHEWHRYRGKADMPELPFIRYHRRLATSPVHADNVIRRMQRTGETALEAARNIAQNRKVKPKPA